MKKLFLATCASLASVASTAFAADLPARVPAVAPAPIFVVSSWTGFYIGLHGGYHMGQGRIGLGNPTDTGVGGLGTILVAGGYPAALASRSEGFIGGLQAGYNYQMGNIVLGVEADISYVDGRESTAITLAPPGFVPATTTSRTKMDWFGTVRARLGFATNSALFYVTGGAAFADSKASFNIVGPTYGPPLNVTGNLNADFGWTAGAGVEFKVANNWTVKGEYLYYDLGRSSAVVNYAYGGNTSSLTGRVRHDGHIVRLGINYLFASAPGPVVAKY